MAKSKKTAPVTSVEPARKLFVRSLRLLRSSWKNFLIFTATYAFFMLVLVQGPAAVSIGDVEQSVAETLPSQSGNAALIAGVFIGESAALGQTASIYGLFLYLIFSMAAIWLIRAAYEKTQVRVRDGFYLGMTGFVPVILVSFAIILQLLPIALGASLYSLVGINNLSVGLIENILMLIILLGLTLWSFYMLAASIPAIYVAALPEVTPMQALRQGKKLVEGRRYKVMIRVLVAILLYAIVVSLLLVLAIASFSAFAPFWWWLVGIVSLPIGHAYFYSLYRSLV